MNFKYLTLLLLSVIVFSSCQNETTPKNKAPKYIFYFIGDGYGPAQAHLAEIFLADQKGRVYPDTLLMNTFPVQGTYTTFAENRVITGSAAAGTALAAGHKTSINTIGMNGNHSESYLSIAEDLHQQGKKIGIITSVSIDHATPAVFYAHQPGFKDPYGKKRKKKASTLDNMGLDKGNQQKANPSDTLMSAFTAAKQAGYRFVQDRQQFDALQHGDDKVISLTLCNMAMIK